MNDTDGRRAEHGPNEGGLKRRLGLGLLTLYGLGIMVGAGIYVLVGEVAGLSGLLAPLVFLLAGLIAAPTAMSYAELTGRIPEAGGEVAWLRDAFGIQALPAAAGLAIVGGATLSAAAVIQGGAAYLWSFLPLPVEILRSVPSSVLIPPLIAAMALLAIRGVAHAMLAAAAFTVIEVGGLLLAIWAGFISPPTAEWGAGLGGSLEAMGGWGAMAPGLGVACMLAFFAFIGFEDMVNMAEETHDPGRTMWKAILMALGATAVLYALVAAAALHAVPSFMMDGMGNPLFAVVRTGAPELARLMALIGGIAALNGVLAQMVMGSRVLYGSGRRFRALGWLARTHPRWGTPVPATLLVAALVLVVAMTVPLGRLAAGSSMVLLAVFVGVNVALVALREKGPAPEGAWTAPRWAPWAGAILSALAVAAGLFGATA